MRLVVREALRCCRPLLKSRPLDRLVASKPPSGQWNSQHSAPGCPDTLNVTTPTDEEELISHSRIAGR